MRIIPLVLLSALFMSGCIPRIQTEVPAFSGIVADSNSGLPLAGVQIKEQTDHAPKDWTPQSSVTGTDGRFSYPAVTSGTVYQMLTPGAGWPVRRTLTFHKDGYRDTTCRCTNLSLFGEDNRAAIPLLMTNHSEPAIERAPMVRLTNIISCQAFVGSRVAYEDKPYLIGEIYQWEEQGANWPILSLWPVPPNEGEVVMDVPISDVQLSAPEQQAENKKIK